MTKSAPLSPRAKAIIDQLVVREGLSYADAITRAEREAEAAAAPYREVAREIRRWREDLAKREAAR